MGIEPTLLGECEENQLVIDCGLEYIFFKDIMKNILNIQQIKSKLLDCKLKDILTNRFTNDSNESPSTIWKNCCVKKIINYEYNNYYNKIATVNSFLETIKTVKNSGNLTINAFKENIINVVNSLIQLTKNNYSALSRCMVAIDCLRLTVKETNGRVENRLANVDEELLCRFLLIHLDVNYHILQHIVKCVREIITQFLEAVDEANIKEKLKTPLWDIGQSLLDLKKKFNCFSNNVGKLYGKLLKEMQQYEASFCNNGFKLETKNKKIRLLLKAEEKLKKIRKKLKKRRRKFKKRRRKINKSRRKLKKVILEIEKLKEIMERKTKLAEKILPEKACYKKIKSILVKAYGGSVNNKSDNGTVYYTNLYYDLDSLKEIFEEINEIIWKDDVIKNKSEIIYSFNDLPRGSFNNETNGEEDLFSSMEDDDDSYANLGKYKPEKEKSDDETIKPSNDFNDLPRGSSNNETNGEEGSMFNLMEDDDDDFYDNLGKYKTEKEKLDYETIKPSNVNMGAPQKE